MLSSSGCTHNHYYGASVPACGPTVVGSTVADGAEYGAVCEVPNQVVSGGSVVAQHQPGATVIPAPRPLAWWKADDDVELLRPREVRGEERKGAPGEREPDVAVEAPAEQLEVVRDDDEAAGDDEGARSRGRRVTAPTTPIATAPAIETTASATSTRPGSACRSGRPLSSSSACAPIPTARKNAASVGEEPSQANAGVSAAPIAT